MRPVSTSLSSFISANEVTNSIDSSIQHLISELENAGLFVLFFNYYFSVKITPFFSKNKKKWTVHEIDTCEDWAWTLCWSFHPRENVVLGLFLFEGRSKGGEGGGGGRGSRRVTFHFETNLYDCIVITFLEWSWKISEHLIMDILIRSNFFFLSLLLLLLTVKSKKYYFFLIKWNYSNKAA